VAQKVAGALALKLLPAEQARLTSVRTVNPEAYEAYLKGLRHWYRLTPGDLDRALSYFELALEKDPNDALAHVGVAMVWGGRDQMGIAPPGEGGPKAKAAALRAVALDDSLAEAHSTLAGVMAWQEWDWVDAGREFERAIELNPSYAHVRAFYSHYLLIVGRPDEAIPQIEKAVELDPLNALFQAFYAMDLVWVGRYDEGIKQARKVLKTAPDNHFATSALWMAYELKGADAEALAVARADNASDPELLRAIDQGSAEGGYKQAMRRAAETLEARARTTHVSPMDVAGFYDSAGDKQHALDWMEKALRARDPNLPYVVLRHFRNSIGDDPRSNALRRGMNLPVR
jgi:tetratricopeptide (TPR) repeat protein